MGHSMLRHGFDTRTRMRPVLVPGAEKGAGTLSMQRKMGPPPFRHAKSVVIRRRGLAMFGEGKGKENCVWPLFTFTYFVH
jgi:hypothetical protein